MITYLNKTVGKLMSKDLIQVNPNTLMTEVSKLFEANNFHHIPVVDSDGICVGIMSKLDYYQVQDRFTRLDGNEACEFKNNKFLATLLASDIMSKDPISVSSDVELSDIIPIFMANSVHSLVVTENKKCVGIITPFDLMKYLQEIIVSYQKAIA